MKEKINKLIIAKDGWPLEKFKKRPIVNFVRKLLHGKEIVCRDCWYSKEAIKQAGVGGIGQSPIPPKPR